VEVEVAKRSEEIWKKKYSLSNLPKKLRPYYQYAKQICEILEAKTQKEQMTDNNGTYTLWNTCPKL